jgi:HD-GYP domain-containing protein (c-di-GMP phosphodiesterase class II)
VRQGTSATQTSHREFPRQTIERFRLHVLRAVGRQIAPEDERSHRFVEEFLSLLAAEMAGAAPALLDAWLANLPPADCPRHKILIDEATVTAIAVAHDEFGRGGAATLMRRRDGLLKILEAPAHEKAHILDPYGRATGVAEALLVSAAAVARPVAAHMRAVAALSRQFAPHFGLSEHDSVRLRLAAMVFDLGKLQVPADVLHYEDGLDSQKWAMMQQHVSHGVDIVAAQPDLAALDIHSIIAAHHERFDGFGYPNGSFGGEIPLLARMLAVMDAHYAMITPRPYREPLTVPDALEQLRNGAGSQWDPGIVAEFISLIRRPFRGPEQSEPVDRARAARTVS